MNARALIQATGGVAVALLLAGCAEAPKSYDYANYREHLPRSILVLPPLNHSTDVRGTYGYLSTVTFPLAEMGYYVFPVAIVDELLKENGLPTAGEMHQVPLKKVAEIVGADAVLYVTLLQYGTKYQVLNSATVVRVSARLVDTRTELLLWEGEGVAQQNSGGTGSIIGDLIAAATVQAIHSGSDAAHAVCGPANRVLFFRENYGLLPGPYKPESEKAR